MTPFGDSSPRALIHGRLARIVRPVNRRLIRFLLLMAACWLPVQTMAAMVMPLCSHAQQQAAVEAHCHDADPGDAVQHDAGCDNCEICHLGTAGFMASAPLIAGVLPIDRHFQPVAISAPPSHIAEPPQQPPRRRA